MELYDMSHRIDDEIKKKEKKKATTVTEVEKTENQTVPPQKPIEKVKLQENTGERIFLNILFRKEKEKKEREKREKEEAKGQEKKEITNKITNMQELINSLSYSRRKITIKTKMPEILEQENEERY